MGPGPFGRLISWKLPHPSVKGSAYQESLDSVTLSLPPLPIDAYTSQSQPDTWTPTGWTKAHIRHLLDALFTWEALPVSPLYHDEFFQDFYSDSSRFCSSALVYSMLAAASRLINENHDDSRLLSTGWLGSKVFSDEAEIVLQRSRQAESLPEVQALGFLSLYHVRYGREGEASGFRRPISWLSAIQCPPHHSGDMPPNRAYILCHCVCTFGSPSRPA